MNSGKVIQEFTYGSAKDSSKKLLPVGQVFQLKIFFENGIQVTGWSPRKRLIIEQKISDNRLRRLQNAFELPCDGIQNGRPINSFCVLKCRIIDQCKSIQTSFSHN